MSTQSKSKSGKFILATSLGLATVGLLALTPLKTQSEVGQAYTSSKKDTAKNKEFPKNEATFENPKCEATFAEYAQIIDGKLCFTRESAVATLNHRFDACAKNDVITIDEWKCHLDLYNEMFGSRRTMDEGMFYDLDGDGVFERSEIEQFVDTVDETYPKNNCWTVDDVCYIAATQTKKKLKTPGAVQEVNNFPVNLKPFVNEKCKATFNRFAEEVDGALCFTKTSTIASLTERFDACEKDGVITRDEWPCALRLFNEYHGTQRTLDEGMFYDFDNDGQFTRADIEAINHKIGRAYDLLRKCATVEQFCYITATETSDKVNKANK